MKNRLGVVVAVELIALIAAMFSINNAAHKNRHLITHILAEENEEVESQGTNVSFFNIKTTAV